METTIQCAVCRKTTDEPSPVFCPACGWGLGALSVSVVHHCSVSTDYTGEARFELLCENTGKGFVRFSVTHRLTDLVFRDDPNFLTAGGTAWAELAPGERLELPGRVPAQHLRDAKQVSLVFHATDCRPPERGSTARDSLHPEAREQPVSVPVRPVTLVCPRPMPDIVVFPRRGRRGRLRIGNAGAADLTYEIGPLPSGFSFAAPNPASETPEPLNLSADNRIQTVTLGPGQYSDVYIEAPPLYQPWREATFEVRVNDRLPHTVQLFREPLEDILSGGISQVIGLDFGTDKTAVFATNYDPSVHARQQPRELVVQPSTIHFPATPGARPRIGVPPDRIPPEDVSVRGMKLMLTWPPDRTLDVSGRAYRPADLLHIFLQEVIPQAHRALQAPGLDPRTDVFHVLTTPVMGTPDERATRAQLMQDTAVAVGLAPERVSTQHTESDCAAIDFVHQMLLGRKPYTSCQLRPGDVICVVDAGAGTTDISLLRWSARSEEQRDEIRFDQLGSVGFDFGGYEIDRLIVYELCRKAGVEPRRVPEQQRRPGALPWQDVSLDMVGTWGVLLTALRIAKEHLYDAVWETEELSVIEPVAEWEAHFPGTPTPSLSYDELAQLVAERVRQLLIGSPGSAPSAGSLPGCLEQAGVAPGDVRWVFLTGGSSRVIQIGDCIVEFFKAAANTNLTVITAPPEDAPLSVARGAALRYAYTIEGSLPCALSLEVCGPDGSWQSYKLLPARDMPGAVREQKVFLNAGYDVGFRVLGHFGPARPTGAVHVDHLDLSEHDTDPHLLVFRVSYLGAANGHYEARLRVTASLRSTGEVLHDEESTVIVV